MYNKLQLFLKNNLSSICQNIVLLMQSWYPRVSPSPSRSSVTFAFTIYIMKYSINYILLIVFTGWIRDVFGSYTVSLTFISALEYCSITLWWLLPAARAFDERANQLTTIEKEHHKADHIEKQNKNGEILPLIEKPGQLSNKNTQDVSE